LYKTVAQFFQINSIQHAYELIFKIFSVQYVLSLDDDDDNNSDTGPSHTKKKLKEIYSEAAKQR
jgi:hypothetical protein